jgi:N6-adenosine-specific RNA methylase IME4
MGSAHLRRPRERAVLEPFPTVEGGFKAVYADPPWRFATRDGKKSVPTRAADPYETMTLRAIKDLPVADVAARDAYLFLWATWPCLPQALEVMTAWGFTYKSGGAWAKRSGTGASWHMGTGYLFRSASEVLLVGSRGKPKWLSRSERNLWVAPVREHSEKPDEVYGLIERSVAEPHLELFARRRRPFWWSWGDGVNWEQPRG